MPSTQLDALVTQHGRDQLHANWPDLFHPDQEAMLPAEELLLLKQGGDYGWPECRAQLTPDQVAAVAAYVWSLSHWAVRGSGKHVDHP
ncbi:MAG TPA: hypothetical protein VJ255_09845 [Candidatus Acidoferrum sp.]|nr:hypothetical protein [Candidatus Acidoferrum sp.]